MQYFTPDFLNFFYELSQNNNRDWFNENRKWYEDGVKAPFKIFVKDLILAIQESDPTFVLEPKNAIFRINRDIRFSKDKTPYKEHVGAILTSSGRKNKEEPGHYVHLSGGTLMLGGGAYFLEKNALYSLRKHLLANGLEFDQLLAEKKFKKLFGELKGKKNKRLPKEFMEHVTEVPLLLNKQFYYSTELPPEKMLSKNLLTLVMKHFKASAAVNLFLKEGIIA